ncbi:MAG: TolC family protein [Candidatus Edwardsbacteria bacterium]
MNKPRATGLFPIGYCLLFIVLFPEFTLATQDSIPPHPLTVGECVEIALENNPSLLKAKSSLAIASAGVQSASARVLPQIGASSGYTKSEQSLSSALNTMQENYQTTFSATQTIFDLGQFSRLSAAKSNKKASEENFVNAKSLLVFNVKQAFYSLVKAKKLVEVAEGTLRQSEEQKKRVKKMQELGAASLADLLKVEVRLSENKLNLLKAKNALKNARLALAIVMGVDPQENLEIIDELPSADMDTIPSVENLIALALKEHPEIKETQANLRGAKSSVYTAFSQKFPTLSASASYGYSSKEWPKNNEMWKAHDSWSVGLNLNFHLFDGLLTEANIREAKARKRIAENTYQETRLTIISEVKKAYLELLQSKEKINLTKETIKQAEEDYRLTQERYRLGSASLLELLTSQVSLTQARQGEIEALCDYQIAKAQLERAVGLLK